MSATRVYLPDDYKAAVETAIGAAGHTVEWINVRGQPTAHIDGRSAGVKGFAHLEYVFNVVGVDYRTIWRRRMLPGDPKKASELLLERHAVVLRVERERAKRTAAAKQREEHGAELDAALGDLCQVEVRGGVSLHFRSLTIEQAAKIAAALRAP
jgi:hypothetical protein